MYRFVDAVVVRAAAFQPGAAVAPWPDLAGGTGEQVAQWRCWLQQVWASEAVAAAIEVASPVLARRVREVCEGRRVREREVRRAVLSVMRYLLRATSRATPFGLFAGVAPARVGSRSVARFGNGHHSVARVDAGWLGAVISRLEACHELRNQLPVVRNNLAFLRDGRLVVGCQQQAGTEPVEVSVRHTAAVRTVLRAAQAPIRLGDLASKLATDFPGRPDSVINGMLAGLVAQRILITSLRPPMTTADPLAHVIEALAAAGAGTVPTVADLLGALREIHTELIRHNRAASRPEQRRDLRAGAARKMTAIVSAGRPVTVDLRLDCGVVLPHAVAREAETTAAALVRLTPNPSGSPAWQDYHHARFLERYGLRALVPVGELLNAGSGLGFPAGYRDSWMTPPPRPGLSGRDAALLALAQHAALRQSTEIVLDEEMIAGLAVGEATAARVQPHTELRFRVHAPTLGALDRGEFELAITGVSRAAGTTTGRFLDLFGTGDRARMVSTYTGLPTVNENALPVQLSCPAVHARTGNVTRSPAVLPHLLALAEHRTCGDTVLPLDDLAVSADAQRLYLVSLSLRRPVEPMVFSAVELTHHAHPLLRFLCEMSTACLAACTPFSWGAATRLPFLPRVRYRRSILSPAMWALSAAGLPGPAAPWRDWSHSLAAWRGRLRVPAAVYLGEGDRRIRLDLDEPAHLHVVRAELDRSGHTTVREAPDPSAFGWIDGRAHDIVIPLAATARPVPPRAWPGRAISREHGHLPGSGDWLYVKLYAHPDRHTAILTTHLPHLLSAWDSEPQWWFIRYEDPEQHLRLRVRLRGTDDASKAAARVAEWAAGLRRLGLVGQVQWDTYYPETGRFGEASAMTAAESVFAADSAAVIAQLRAAGRRSGPHQHAVIAASMADLAIAVTGGVEDGMRWLIQHIRAPSLPPPAREVHRQAILLADPGDDWAVLRAQPGGKDIVSWWARRRVALARYRDALAAAGEIAPDSVLPDLLHLHHARSAGICPDTEWACRRLARAAALSWTSRTRGTP
ncbi:MAG: lantibiotic dehydratase [Pseudonocardiaceae bacterium]